MTVEVELKAEPIITAVMKPLGYKRDGSYWYKETETHYYFLNLNTAYYGHDRFIDIGVSLKCLLPAGKSFKNGWEYRQRINEIAVFKGAMIYAHDYKLLTLEERERFLREGLISVAIPELEALATIEQVTAAYHDGKSGFGRKFETYQRKLEGK